MPNISKKHNVSEISFYDISGGINSSLSPELINSNQFQICRNFEYYPTGKKLKRRGGISAPLVIFNNQILSVFYDFEINIYLVFLQNKEIYTTNLNTSTYIGQLSGNLKPKCCKFGNKILIASGDKLQSYDYSTLKTIDNSPLCDIVFERFGRVVVARAGDDNLYYSAVGDEENWTNDPNVDSSSQYLEIGYKDGGDIVALIPMVTDIFIFKSNGKIYQLSGEYANWSVYEIGRNSDTNYRFAVENMGQVISFLSSRGLLTLQTVQTYGNIQTTDIGDNFNNLLVKNIYHPTLWNIRRKNQLLIRPAETETVYAYHYNLGALTELQFPQMIIDFLDTPYGCIIAMGNSLYYWDDKYINDNGSPIYAELKFKKYRSNEQYLITSLKISTLSTSSGNCLIAINELPITHSWLTNKTQQYKLNYHTKELEIDITTTSYMELDYIVLEVATI